MSNHRLAEVSARLAHYLGHSGQRPFHELELQRELGFEPLDLVLFVLAFEEAEGLVFPFEDLERVITVGDLIVHIASWLDDYDYAEQMADVDEPPTRRPSHRPSQSGMWAVEIVPNSRGRVSRVAR
jgi:hypothetical protein